MKTLNPAADEFVPKSTWCFHQDKRRSSLSASVIKTDETSRSSASLRTLRYRILARCTVDEYVFRPDSPTCGYVANTADRLQVLKKGTRLGNIEPGDIVGPAPPEPTSSIAPKTTSSVWIRPTTVQPTGETKEMSTEQVIECITKSLPTELTDCQRRQVRRLIERNESIFSKSEYGIGTRTKIASYPLPLIDNCVNAVAGASWFSTLDLRSGYYNTPLADEDRDKQVGIHYSQRLSRIHCYAIWIDMRTQRLPETHGLRLGRTVVRHLPRLF